MEGSAHAHRINSIKLYKSENIERASEIWLMPQDSVKTYAKESYGTMNSTGVENEAIGAGLHIRFQ
jgi:hypothetical protein